MPPISRDLLDQLRHVWRPIATRVANTVARGVVRNVDDSTKLQLVQIGVLAGETIDGAEHFQPYGFCSVPLAGAEHVTVFPNGDRSHPITIVVSDRRYRPTGGDPGDVTVYNHIGTRVSLKADGSVEVRSVNGSPQRLPTVADVKAIRDAIAGAVVGTNDGGAALKANIVTALDAIAGWPVGTHVLKAE